MANLVESSGSASASASASASGRSMGAKRSGEVDRISSLPASVIQHILSFLPTKDVVATCVLSTKWAKHWRLVPKLELKVSGFPKGRGQDFVNFVNRVFMLHKAPILESVRISLGAHVDSSCVGTWIETALDRGVKEMNMSVFSLDSPRLPLCLFTSKTLVTMKLTFQITLNVPAYVHLPCVKILHLLFFKYPNKESILRFLGVCPVLEELIMSGRWKDSVPNLVISVATLKRLVLYAHEPDHLKFICNLVLNNPSLYYLDLKGIVIRSCSLTNLAEVSEASMDIPCYVLSKILLSLRGIRKLSMRIFDQSGSENCSNGCARKLEQTFHYLIQLEINLIAHHWNLFLKLLGCSPKLQVLILFKDFHYDGYLDVQMSKTQILPESLSMHLKTFFFRCFSGSEHEQRLLERILVTAQSLETVKICLQYFMDLEEKYHMSNNLLSLKWSSSRCKIVVLDD